jgi:hypothetical protein
VEGTFKRAGGDDRRLSSLGKQDARSRAAQGLQFDGLRQVGGNAGFSRVAQVVP